MYLERKKRVPRRHRRSDYVIESIISTGGGGRIGLGGQEKKRSRRNKPVCSVELGSVITHIIYTIVDGQAKPEEYLISPLESLKDVAVI